MNTLSEEKFLLVSQYICLLDIIEEAFEHIYLCLEDMRFEDDAQLWDDVTMAFMQIHISRKVLAEHFIDLLNILQQFMNFGSVWGKVQALQYADFNLWEEVLGESVYPAFAQWSKEISKQFRPYYIN